MPPSSASLAHVDIVPAGDDWSSPPFAAEIVNGAIVARGVRLTIKVRPSLHCGPSSPSKSAPSPSPSALRLILGADEESGFGCVQHYFTHEEMPETGFTPDAMFPLVYAEKGIANAILTRSAPPEGERIHMWSALAGGLRHEYGARPCGSDFAQFVSFRSHAGANQRRRGHFYRSAG